MKSALFGLSLVLAIAALTPASPSLAGVSQNDETYADRRERPGMGRSEADPIGADFDLPPGLELVSPMMGYNTSNPEDCDHKYEDQAVGHGEDVRLCLVFRNRTGGPIRLELPPGLVFVSRNRAVQNGMLAKRVAIEVPAGERFFQPLFLYCINGERDGSNPEEAYGVGPVIGYPEMVALFRFLETKDVNASNFAIVAATIHELNNFGKLDAFAQSQLDSLPDL